MVDGNAFNAIKYLIHVKILTFIRKKFMAVVH